MPRISRNSVQFQIGSDTFLAVFSHQHCKESRDSKDLMEIEERDARGWPTFRFVRRVIKPLTFPTVDQRGRKVVEKLRHITTCTLHRGTEVVAVGTSRCSVKDDYNWKKGIKRAFTNTLVDLEVRSGQDVNEGQFLSAFYSELPKRS